MVESTLRLLQATDSAPLADPPSPAWEPTPAPTDGAASLDRESHLGVVIAAVAGTAWAQWGASGVGGAVGWAIRLAGILVGLVIVIGSGRRWRRVAEAGHPRPAPRSGSKPIFPSPGFIVVNVLQVVALAGGARILTAAGHPDYLIAWSATVVGLHFLALSRLSLPGLSWLGAALITAGAAGLAVGVCGGGPGGIKVASGLMAATSLFAAGGWSTARMLGGRP
ncbi:MAG: hypothetical protein ABIS47_04030 [Acidimicrobiales bacterium]